MTANSYRCAGDLPISANEILICSAAGLIASMRSVAPDSFDVQRSTLNASDGTTGPRGTGANAERPTPNIERRMEEKRMKQGADSAVTDQQSAVTRVFVSHRDGGNSVNSDDGRGFKF